MIFLQKGPRRVGSRNLVPERHGGSGNDCPSRTRMVVFERWLVCRKRASRCQARELEVQPCRQSTELRARPYEEFQSFDSLLTCSFSIPSVFGTGRQGGRAICLANHSSYTYTNSEAEELICRVRAVRSVYLFYFQWIARYRGRVEMFAMDRRVRVFPPDGPW